MFNRLGKQLQVTATGRKVYLNVLELLTAYSKIQNISSDALTVKGELRIGASESLTIYKLGTVLSQYKSTYPEVNISLINDHCPLLRERLHSGELDIALTLEPIVSDPQLLTDVLSEEPLVFVGTGDHTFGSIDDLAGASIIFSEKRCSLRKFFEAYLADKGIDSPNNLEFTSMEAMKQCVVSGLGVSLMPYMSVEALLFADKVKAIDCFGDDLKLYAQISYHKNKWLSNAHLKFIEMVMTAY